MTNKYDIDADQLMPFLPGVLTPTERTEICRATNKVIQSIGVAHQLSNSAESNLAEFRATLIAMFEKVRNDLQPTFLSVVDALTQSAEGSHTAFLNEVDSSYRNLIREVQQLQGEVTTREKLENRQESLDSEYEARRQRLQQQTEDAVKELLDSMAEHLESDPNRTVLRRKVETLAKENAELKQLISDVYKLVQDIGLLNIYSKRSELLELLGRQSNAGTKSGNT